MSIVTTSANYWISPTALNITRNALGEPNRIQASIASGAVIVCYVRGVEGLEYDNGHNYRRWPLAIAPTYFNSNSEKYVYVAIPKSNQIGTSAMVIFPSQKIDIEGYTIVRKPILDKDGKMHDSAGNETTDADKAVSEESQGQRIVPENHFYVWLQGILSSSGDNGTTEREWLQEIQTGTLSTDEALDTRDTSWYTWNPITQTVTFLKEIWMDTAAVFNNLRAKVLILNGHSLKGVAVRGETPSDSDDTIVTPAYLDDIDASKYLRKDQDDRTEYSLGIGGNLNVDGNTNIGGNLNVDGDETVNGTLFANQSVRTDEIRSSNYTGDTIADTGYLLTAGQANGLGHSKLTIDEIYVRMKAVFESLEVRKWSVVAGDEIRSCAANIINRVDYFTDTGELLGYSQVRVPWMAKRVPFLLRKFGMSQSGWGRYIYSKLIRMRITLSNDGLSRVRYCRCYFLANDGDTEIENWWQANDLVRCQTMNVTVTNRQTYTSIVRKQGNVFWWRKCLRVSKNGVAPSENPDITNCQPAIIDEKTYHWFDVAFDGSLEFDPLTGEMTGRTDGNWMAGSDLPAAGDHAVQFGNTTIPGRMNLWITMVNGGSSRDYDPDGDAPCIKGFAGIYTFDLTKCYTGGHPCKMTLAPGKKYHFYGRDFRIITEYGVEPVPVPRGEWTEIPFEQDEYKYRKTYTDDLIDDAAGTHTRSDRHSLDYARKCYWNDEVSHKGCLWLCSLADGSHWKAESAFTHNGTTYAVGSLVPPGVYSALSNENQARCRSCQNYTTDEPNSTSGSWTKLVDRGTSIKNVESRYQKKSRLKHNSTLNRDEIDETAGTVPPNLPWEQWKMESQIGQLQMKDGDYFWTCTKTEYSDTLAPTYEYKVSRWGIDSDGITVNAYFLGLRNTEARVTTANDNYKMPGTSGWSSAEVQAKWFDTFDEMAQANGGVGAMQGWNVWTKTVIRYDADENRAYDEQRADVVNYACTRIGQDGQIAQEEYYMLAASDDFNIVFGSATPNYTQCGIRWYNQSDPAKERYRLSSTTPNINTSIWTPNRPTYNKAVHGSRVYLWNFEYRVDGQGTPYATRPVCIGNHARGIMGVRELYACSAYGQPQTGRKFPNDIYDYSSSHPYTDPNVWTDEIYDRAPSEALPYQWNWTRTLYSSPRDASDTQRDAATGYFYEDIYHVSSVRGTKGEDGAGTEYIYCRTKTSTAPTGHNGTTGTANGTSISGTATVNGTTYNKCRTVDDFVPTGWTDNPVGISHDYPYEWVCERKSTSYSGTGEFSGGHIWGEFSTPQIRSKWGYNGVDGDGVEYVFMRTKNDVPPTFAANDGGNSTDYKSQEWLPYINNKGTGSGQANAESNRCTDDPKGTTRDWPYEWVAKRTMGDPSTATANMGHRDWKSYYESMTDHKMSKWANYAENSIRLDLDNEMDMVQTDSAGKVMAARTVETVVHFYDGAREVKLATGDITASGATKTASGNGVKLSWTYNAGSTFTGAEITVSYTYPAVGTTYTAVFTIAPSMGHPIYQLSPKLSAIIFSRTSTNTLTPASLALGLGIVKIDGGSTTELSSVPSGYTVRWAYDTMPTSNTAGNGWTSGNIATIASSTANSSVCIVLFYGSVVIDRETVPIVKDGENGDGIESVTRTYARSTQSTSTNDSTAPTGIDTSIGTNGWSTNSPAVTETYPYLWAREIVTYKYKTATTKYYMIGARGTNGVDGKDGYTILVTPANHIIKQPETSPYTIGSTQLANAYSTISVKRGDTDVSFTIKSVIGTNCTAQKQGNSQVKITEIKTNNGQYYDQGYVTVVITINGKDYTVRINFYCNLLGTWKQSVENGVETIVAKKVTYTLTGEEDTDIETAKNEFDSYRDAVKSVQTWKEQKETTYNGYASQISSANTQINNANTSISQLRTTVNGHTDSISSIEQTSEAIKMGVYNGWDEIVLYKDVRSSVRANYGTTEGRASEAYSSYYDKLGSADIPSGSYYIEVSYEIMIGSSANDGSVSLSMYYNNGYDDDTFIIKVGDVKSGAYVARKEYLRKNYKIQRFDSFELYNGLIDSNKQYTVYAYIRNLKIAVVSDSDGALAKTGIDIEKGVIRLTSANTEMSGNLKVKGNYFVNFSVINSKTFADYVTISGSKYIINLSATGNNVQLGQFTSSSGQFDTSVQELNICLPAITSDMVGMEINICNMYTVNGTPRGFLISSNGANASMYELKTGISTKTSTTLPFGYTKKFIAVAFAGVISGVSCAWVEQD